MVEVRRLGTQTPAAHVPSGTDALGRDIIGESVVCTGCKGSFTESRPGEACPYCGKADPRAGALEPIAETTAAAPAAPVAVAAEMLRGAEAGHHTKTCPACKGTFAGTADEACPYCGASVPLS